MKRAFLIATLLSFAPAAAPVNDSDNFDSFINSALNDFDSFIDESHRDFLNFMRNPWKKYDAEKPVEKRVVPEPEAPVEYTPAATPENEKPSRLSVEEILDLTTGESSLRPVVTIDGDNEQIEAPKTDVPEPPKPSKPVTKVIRETTPVEQKPAVKPEPAARPEAPANREKPVKQVKPATPAVKKPVTDRPEPKKQDPLYTGGANREKFSYGGYDYYLSNQLRNSIRLNSLNENAIADAYETLLRSDYTPLIADLKQLQKSDLKNEWALFMMIRAIAESYCRGNESMVMRQFLLNQLGYKARMARIADENRLTLFVAPDCALYGCIYVEENGTRFYDVDAKKPYAFFMCKKDSPTAKAKIRMSASSHPHLRGASVSSTRKSPASGAAVTVNIPKSLMDFYNDFPQCDYKVYAQASVDKNVEAKILSSLRPLVQGKSETEAAGLLLDFVQSGFEYATDDKQFGYEKPFFVEELFYYPYCDCEDRSILYRYLVKNLLGLDVVLLDYPNHIATAVRFNSNVEGDYITIDGKKYTVCDPTYIGAGIGKAMPVFKNTPAKALRL